MNINKEECLTTNQGRRTVKSSLRKAIRMALIGSVLASGASFGQLQDHGPGMTLLRFPVWYRDNNNIPLQLCTSQAPSPADGITPLCFPLPPDPAPAFAGNIGPEAFYMNLNANVTTGAIDLRYVAALEAAYGTANPVGAPVLGQELVFSRVRFLMHVTTGSNCDGDYRIRHPYGTDNFTDVPEGKRALFATNDVPLGLIGNFDGALAGDIGPFLQSDSDGNGVADPAIIPANGSADRFIGDPSVEVPYVGSQFVNNVDNTTQNYVEVEYVGPHTVGTNAGECNLDGVGGGKFRVSTGFLLGQLYTTPIPTPTKATNAIYSRAPDGTTTLDVYAQTAPGQTLLAVGQGMPNVQMTQELTGGGANTRFYHAHVEYPGPAPANVKVLNITSNPIISSEIGTNDVITISRAVFDPFSRKLCVNAHSSDQSPDTGAPSLSIETEGPNGGTFGAIDCDASFGSKPNALDLSYQVDVPKTLNAQNWTSAIVQVTSSAHGKTSADVVTLTGNPDNVGLSPVAGNDVFDNVSDTLVSTHVVGGVGGNDNPADLTPIILTQPATGSVVAAGVGQVTFTPGANTVPGPLNFSYVTQNGTQVSNIATVQLNVVADTSAPPVTAPDNFAVQTRTATRNTSFTINVLANDKAGKNTQLAPASVQVSATGVDGSWANAATIAGNGAGTATSNGDGTITFVPLSGGSAGVTAFFYRVSSNANVPSAGTRVNVSVAAGAENVVIQRARIQAGNWAIRVSDTTVGWTGAPLTPRMYCYLVRNNTTNTNFAPARYIGSALIPAGGAAFDVTAVAGTVSDNGATVVPAVTTGQSVVIQCGSSNHASPLPSLTSTANTPTFNLTGG